MRKLISILAAVCVVLTMVPAAFADDSAADFAAQDQPAFAGTPAAFADDGVDLLMLTEEPGTDDPVPPTDDPVPVTEGWQAVITTIFSNRSLIKMATS